MLDLRNAIGALGAAFVMTGCVDSHPGTPADLHPQWVSLGGDGRIAYELTGPDFDSPHRPVSDIVWEPAPYAITLSQEMHAAWEHPAPYVAGSTIVVEAPFIRHGGAPTTLDVHVTASLREGQRQVALREAHASLPFVESKHIEGALRSTTSPLVVELPVPDRAALYDLELTWVLDDGDVRVESLTSHRIPVSLHGPLEGVPVYRETALWAAEWVGELAADDSDHEVAWALTRGIRTLTSRGYSYGAFDRPDSDDIATKADVFIDHERSACGEFRGLLMALLEFHGVDAKWVWFKFEDEPSDPDAAPFRAYRTRRISAVGREAKQWYDTNHSIVGVGDRVYDPTYTVWKPTWQAYEDWMFEAYCWGDGDEPDDATCVANPPGYDARTLGFNRYVSDSLK